MKNFIVLGAGFGDEGKGLVTNHLVKENEGALVIRFNGGHQAGHTVMYRDIKHVFSNFGSGTLRGSATYWSKYCTVEPKGFMEEYRALQKMDIYPKIYIDRLCPVTTPWDICYNKAQEIVNGHGSVGVGFGSTIARQEAYFKLHAGDLMYPEIVKEKLKNINSYYLRLTKDFSTKQKAFITDEMYYAEKLFSEDIKQFLRIATLTNQSQMGRTIADYRIPTIFEGAQGILLDMDFGFFPNVTRSNTTSKNALQLTKDLNLTSPEIYYVSRCYQTRHGNGFMTNENHELLKLKNTEHETNILGQWQGNFRKGLLDHDLLDYAIDCDKNLHTSLPSTLVFTCKNQIDGDFLFTRGGDVQKFLPCGFKVGRTMFSSSPYGELY